jgi:hypothetical protein
MRTRLRGATLLATIAVAFANPAFAALLRAPGGGVVHALVIGINDYPNLGGHSLRGARADAEDIAAVLEKDGVADLTLLRDQEATRATIVGDMDRLIATSAAGDLVIVTYAGHGMQTPEYPRWRGIDKNGVNEQIALSSFSFSGRGAGEVIVNEEVRAWLSRLDAKGVDALVVWDSCFGGGMRGIAPGGGEIRVRQVQGDVEEAERNNFVGIPMTDREARANVKAMPHVTFLAGATAKSVVPEMDGVDPRDPATPRGALSYYVARALEGTLKDRGDVPRSALFDFLKQAVTEATAERQAIQVDPQSEDTSISGRPVFEFGAGDEPGSTATVAPRPQPGEPLKSEAVAPVRVKIVNGSPDLFASIETGATPLIAVADDVAAELVWDVGGRAALAQGDVLMQNVDGSMIGAIADRVRALTLLRSLGANRPLQVRLETGGALLTSGAQTGVEVDGLQGAHLVVFNVAADATVQMLYPAPPEISTGCRDPSADAWRCELVVEPPFGVDTVVAVAAAGDLAPLYRWLTSHHGHRDAADVPTVFQGLLADDPDVRIGFVPVVTRATAY